MDDARLAELAQLVYRRGDETESQWRSALDQRLHVCGWRLIKIVDRKDTQAIIATPYDRCDAIAVAFRGTEPLRGLDVSTCIRCLAREDINGYVHAGFAIALDAVWLEIATELSNQGKRHLYLTGHSLGGALAIIAASRLLRPFNVARLVTFGAPPCIAPELCQWMTRMLNGSCVRYESADWVTMVLRLWYGVPGRRNYIRADGSVIERAGAYVATIDRLRVLAGDIATTIGNLFRWNWKAKATFWASHSMRKYLTAINAAKL